MLSLDGPAIDDERTANANPNSSDPVSPMVDPVRRFLSASASVPKKQSDSHEVEVKTAAGVQKTGQIRFGPKDDFVGWPKPTCPGASSSLRGGFFWMVEREDLLSQSGCQSMPDLLG